MLLALNPVTDDHSPLNRGIPEIVVDDSFGPNSRQTGAGVILNALTRIDALFFITNQDCQDVDAWITTNGSNTDTVTA